jgi:hypothetical protein
LAQCAGVGCVLVHVVAGEERARKVFSLEGPLGDGETSRLGSRDPVDSGTRCGPHGVAKAWPSDDKTHKHYINAPASVVSPVVELGGVESFPKPAGPDI